MQNTEEFQLNNLLSIKLSQLANTLDRISSHYFETHVPELSLSDARFLLMIGSSEQSSVNEIAKKMNLDKGWVSRSIKRLISCSYIQHKPDPEDARRTLLSLTDSGWRLYEVIKPALLLRNEVASQGLSTGERLLLAELIDRLQLHASSRLEHINNGQSDPAINYQQALPEHDRILLELRRARKDSE